MTVRGVALNRWTLASAALICLGLLPAMLMLYHVRSNWVQVPFWDEWHTPGVQFEWWSHGLMPLRELFGQHNESRKLFPRLLYLALAAVGGWDVRKEMDVVFLEVCLLSWLLWRLLRRSPGSTLPAALVTWVVMMFLCFSPVQFENFLCGIQLEPFFVGLAVVAAASVNLSSLSFRSKTLINLLFALVATYTYANGMLLWLLAFPLAAPQDSTPRHRRILWSGIYLLAAAAAIGFYFVGYQRPSYHPEFVSLQDRAVDLGRYFVFWVGSYFSSDYASPFIAGIVALGLFALMGTSTLLLLFRTKEWRTPYPWVLIGTYAVLTGSITAFGRLNFGVQQALESRYTVFSLFFYLALVGGSFSLYCAHMRESPTARRRVLTLAACSVAFAAVGWIGCYQKGVAQLPHHREYRVKLLDALKWMEVIPDNPDLALVYPSVEILTRRIHSLAEHGIWRVPFIRGPLADQVRQSPANGSESAGRIETCSLDHQGSLLVAGWAWLPGKNQRADYVVIGCKNASRNFKPLSVFNPGVRREYLPERDQLPEIERAGFFSRTFSAANLPAGDVAIEGWAIDLKAERAWPLASSVHLKPLGPSTQLRYEALTLANSIWHSSRGTSPSGPAYHPFTPVDGLSRLDNN
ncbi:MAG: hypothetical protein DMF06_14375 [Verrucomicrobia bacterium]|nr:MAG: hypothetical protein DMF06_14375 [Verrucomicrobiota bacterium]